MTKHTLNTPNKASGWPVGATLTCSACASYEPGENGQNGRCWDEPRRHSENVKYQTVDIAPDTPACHRIWPKSGVKKWREK